ncbi:putative ABC transporter ATP-binding protein YheS [Hypsizygus marmoreus]|uniref:ABC transporter ATP-binding protein YheS n=1 Tax=Hypsizygus marmoreus TaxID=39966 RepID=A0A369JG64_HYPMA|nr:putative ABC transporter ATP-binding protein YheS [Hypsizygus marmoreus]
MPPKNGKRKIEEGGLIVSAQQSRFHVDASDTATTKEIDIKDLTLTIGGRDLLSHATLTLREDKHYVLVGRNGTGKSTLLRALAEGRIPGVPWSLHMLLLGQTDVVNSNSNLDETLANLKFEDGTILEHVMRSDARRERALVEAKHLSEALENFKDPFAIVRAIRKLKHERLVRKHDEMAKIAARRSGARGAKARKELIAAEEQVEVSQLLLEQPGSEIDAVAIQSETRSAVDTLSEIQASLDAMDSASAETRAHSVLLGLGFSPDAILRPFSSLSGGWRTRCSLASALFQKVDILLLDECTNFLDLPAIVWLQAYVQSLTDTTVVVITHDRDFADAVADELLILREQSLEHFKGNLSAYEHERRSQTKYLTRMQAAQDKKTEHMKSSIQSALIAAKRTGDDKKLKQVASRKKKIEERSGIEVGLKGGRFKLNRDLMGYHTTMRDSIEIPTMDPLVKICMPLEPPELRFPGALVSLEKVSFTYPRAKAPTLVDVDLVIHPGERVGIAGLNGSGKSTLVGLIAGVDGPGGGGLRPTKGTVTRHTRAKIHCFSQHAVEALEQKGAAVGELTSLTEMMDLTAGQLSEQEVRGLLSGLGLPGRIASDVPVAALSGGQKVRLALAKLVWSPPHLLVLDEVTTHLDADTVLALVECLKQYRGALLIITHDRFFMRCVVEGESLNESTGDSDEEEEEEEMKGWQAKPGTVYRLFKGQLKALDGGMRKYEAIAEKANGKLGVLR